MRARLLLAATALLGACGEATDQPDGSGSTTPRYERVLNESSLLGETVTAVRIGEYGPSFAACNARGTTRSAAAALPVRAAPYEAAKQVHSLPAASSFFICSRSHDQKWFGIVFAEGGVADVSCGVAAPVTSRRDYDGPCPSGWVSSAFVKLMGA